MNDALEQRYRSGALPFNGQTVVFASDDLTPLPPLRLALLAIVFRLQQLWPEAGLFTLDDWWEHDGFINEANPTSWQSLFFALSSDETLIALSHGDFAVRRAFFPSTYDFYLRIYIPAGYDNDYPELRGNLDVTSDPSLAEELMGLAASASGLPLVEYNAKGFFNLAGCQFPAACGVPGFVGKRSEAQS